MAVKALIALESFFGVLGMISGLLLMADPSGSLIGLDNGFVANIIRAVGNYGEIFERNLGPDTPVGLERGLNDLWTNGGLMYSPPWR